MSESDGDATPIDTDNVDGVDLAGAVDSRAPMDFDDALRQVLKTAHQHDGLARGLRECAKAMDRREAYLCVLSSQVSFRFDNTNV